MNCSECKSPNIEPCWNPEHTEPGFVCIDCEWSVSLGEIAEALELKRTTYTRCIELIVNGKSLYLDEPNVHGRRDSEEVLASYAAENWFHLEQGVLQI